LSTSSYSDNQSKWLGGVLAPNGKIFGMPQNAKNLLIIDPENGTATVGSVDIDSSTSQTMNNKWAGGVLGTNGKI